MQSGNIDVHHKKESSPITMKVEVMVEKLSVSKYKAYLEHVEEPEFIEVSEMHEVGERIKTEEGLDPLSIMNYDDSEYNATVVDMNTEISVSSHCENKIEIVEDLFLKTESSDLSEFIDQ